MPAPGSPLTRLGFLTTGPFDPADPAPGLEEALRLKSETPGAVPIEGGTDVMVELNFDRARPEALLNLNEVTELKGWSRENGRLRLGASLTYDEAMEAADAAAALRRVDEHHRDPGEARLVRECRDAADDASVPDGDGGAVR